MKTQKEVKETMKEYNVQLDNLCQVPAACPHAWLGSLLLTQYPTSTGWGAVMHARYMHQAWTGNKDARYIMRG